MSEYQRCVNKVKTSTTFDNAGIAYAILALAEAIKELAATKKEE